LSVAFALLGFASIKAACKTLVNLTPKVADQKNRLKMVCIAKVWREKMDGDRV